MLQYFANSLKNFKQESTMKYLSLSAAAILGATLICGTAFSAADQPAKANGIQLPQDYKKWRLIGVSHRNDNDSLRAIIGNHTAFKAFQNGTNKPWPDGAIIGKLVWKDRNHPQWPDAIVPGDLSHIEFMVRDKKKYPATGGWRFARWLGMELKPHDSDGSECFACHTRVKNSGYVFTRMAPLP